MVARESNDGLDRQALLTMLRWQLEAGVDEAIQTQPWNRFETSTLPNKAQPQLGLPLAN